MPKQSSVRSENTGTATPAPLKRGCVRRKVRSFWHSTIFSCRPHTTRFSPHSISTTLPECRSYTTYLYSITWSASACIATCHSGNSQSHIATLSSVFHFPNSGIFPTIATPCVGNTCGTTMLNRTLPFTPSLCREGWGGSSLLNNASLNAVVINAFS